MFKALWQFVTAWCMPAGEENLFDFAALDEKRAAAQRFRRSWPAWLKAIAEEGGMDPIERWLFGALRFPELHAYQNAQSEIRNAWFSNRMPQTWATQLAEAFFSELVAESEWRAAQSRAAAKGFGATWAIERPRTVHAEVRRPAQLSD